jgi:hypothetical protein
MSVVDVSEIHLKSEGRGEVLYSYQAGTFLSG